MQHTPKRRRPIGHCAIGHCIAAFLLTLCLVPVTLAGDGPGGGPSGEFGADMIITGIGENGGAGLTKNGTVGDITAYSYTNYFCNIGDEWAIYLANTNQHPLLHQNLYRIKDGQFQQVGQSWLLHTWCAADFFDCLEGSEPNGACNYAAIGMTNVLSTGLMASQTDLGPRSDVDPSSGFYPYPYTIAWNGSGNQVYKRLQVKNDDLADSTGDDGNAIYLSEVHITTTDEVLNGNGAQHNNASWRQVTRGGFSGGGFLLSFTGETIAEEAAIEAWDDFDPTVVISDAFTEEENGFEGRVIAGSRAEDLGDGQWAYSYSVYNMNSTRSVGSLQVEIPEGESINTVTFRDIDYHSGEILDGTDWESTFSEGTLNWSTTPYEENENANAIRFGTAYSFRFVSSAPPERGTINLGLFGPGPGDPQVSVDATVPALDCDDSGVSDKAEIADGVLEDADDNDLADVCQPIVAVTTPLGARAFQADLVSVTQQPFAIRIRGDAEDTAVACVDGFVQVDGSLGMTPVQQSIDDWGSGVIIADPAVIPESVYSIELEGFGLPASVIMTGRWGDANNDGLANLEDVFLAVLGFQGQSQVPIQAIDVTPCEADGVVSLADAYLFVLAFQGQDFEAIGCPSVCP